MPTGISLSSTPPRKSVPSSSSASGSRHRRRKTAENWDDDFEFAFPSKRTAQKENRSPSPEENWGDDWDADAELENGLRAKDSGNDPAIKKDDGRLLRLATATASTATSRQVSGTKIPPPIQLPVRLPRASSSQSSGLPSPDSRSSDPAPPPPLSWNTAHAHAPPSSQTGSSTKLALPPSPAPGAGAGAKLQRSRSGSASRNKLIKRQPSVPFGPLRSFPSSSVDDIARSPPESDLSQEPITVATSPSPQKSRQQQRVLRSSKSGERMPPPPVPINRAKAREVLGSTRNGEVRVSGIPFSPSQEQIRAAVTTAESRRPSFWKRLSGAPSPSRESELDIAGTFSPGRRSRISSFGLRDTGIPDAPPSPSAAPPPVPPLPANVRSSSSSSTASHSSTNSSFRSGQSVLSSMLRRSASGLSRRSDRATPPPSAYPHLGSNRGSSSSVNQVPPTPPVPSQYSASPPPPSSHSFSRGFHLPSPSPNSPYNQLPPHLPHSSSFPVPRSARVADSDTDTETETETEGEENQETPRRRKIRPVSALPAPKANMMGTSRGWTGNDWKGFAAPLPAASDSESGSSHIRQDRSQMAGAKTTRTVGRVSTPTSPTPQQSTFASSTVSTLKRLSSISKKHGRRLSEGWKFNSPSTAPHQAPGLPSASPSIMGNRAVPVLETVMGSPSKPAAAHTQIEEPFDLEFTDEREIDNDRAARAGSVSAPTSSFRQSQQSGSTISAGTVLGIGISTSETALRKKERQSRRQSWNDFVIPSSVLEKQKGLKENISAVKMFASGLESLKTLLETHGSIEHNLSDSSQSAVFDDLEEEFGQWFEMATVLIEVGNTGTAAGGAPASSPNLQSPPRSRRITLASEDAQTVSANNIQLRSVSGQSIGNGGCSSASAIIVPRKISLPDPEQASTSMGGFLSSPPRASPEQWRASTGRQDLSKRQLEVLRTMLRTPISERPPMVPRQSSTLSQPGDMLHTAPSMPPMTSTTIAAAAAASDRSASGASVDSTYIVPSGSFPSPNTASHLANPTRGGLGTRSKSRTRTARPSLAGLKDFLKSIKNPNPNPNPNSNLNTASRPLTPASSHFTRPATLRKQAPLPLPLTEPSSPAPKLPLRKENKRPSLRNIFRTSSGNWNDLVKGETHQRKSESEEGLPAPALPKRASWRDLGESPASAPTPTPREEETIRPGRKSRMIGLGLPPPLPASETVTTQAAASRRTSLSPRKYDSAVSTWNHPPPTAGSDSKGEGEGSPTVVLTPENLPVLLEYLQTCERMLSEWKVRVEASGLLIV